MSEEQRSNGIDVTTGEPLPASEDLAEWAHWIGDPPLEPKTKRFYNSWSERRYKLDPKRAPVYMVDGQVVRVHDLSSSGYGVIFAPGITDEVKR
jgi:hypothetical protein